MTQKKYRIIVNYGYDNHSITVSKKDMDKIRRGEAVSISGQGF